MVALWDSCSAIRKKVERAASLCSRSFNSIQILPVTKYRSVEDIRNLYACGFRDFAESRVVDSLEKIVALPSDIRWHYIGALQKNKVHKVVEQFSLIHSIDSVELAEKVSHSSVRASLFSRVLLQVNPIDEPSKQGFSPFFLEKACREIVLLPNIIVCGLMAMAPKFQGSEKPIHEAFSTTAEAFSSLKSGACKGSKHFTELSMGMSQDFEIAIFHGATIVRIGSAFRE